MRRRKRRSRYRFDSVPHTEQCDTIPLHRIIHVESGQMLSDDSHPMDTGNTEVSRSEFIEYEDLESCPGTHEPESYAADAFYVTRDVKEPAAAGIVSRNQRDEIKTSSDEGGLCLGEENLISQDILSQSSVELHVPNWRVLWALLMTNGSRRLTKEQFQSVRMFATAVGRFPDHGWTKLYIEREQEYLKSPKLSHIPHYSTLAKVWRPLLFSKLAVRSLSLRVPVDISKAGVKTYAASSCGPETQVKLVLPSEYARSDVATPQIFRSMCSTSLLCSREREMHDGPSIFSETDCVDTLPLISARQWFYGPPKFFSVDSSTCSGPYTSFAEPGDTVSMSILAQSGNDLDERFARCFATDTPFAAYNSHLQGEVVHVWTVHHASRKNQPSFTDTDLSALTSRESLIVQAFNFVNYVSPSDSVQIDVPPLPMDESEVPESQEYCSTPRTKKKSPQMVEAQRARKTALKLKRIALESAWREWKKPLLKPGDTIALLRPTGHNRVLTNTDKESRVLIVSRFWCENEERGRHVMWIPGGRDLDTITPFRALGDTFHRSLCAPLCIHGDELHNSIVHITLISAHGRNRGPLAFHAVSSVGKLQNGENYFIYRFLLFWDGFELQSGKSASGDGVYLICLNIPPEARSSSNAVRIITLTPPGVKSDTVLLEVINDVIKGMTTGFLDIDADGVQRRIILDLVGFLGDTPALNAALDVLGHTGASCCHLCRFLRRSSTMIGSRYTAKSHYGSLSVSTRSFYSHTAVRDCGANAETCRLLGMKPDPSSSNLVLHKMRELVLSAKQHVFLTSEGKAVVPCALDPYKSCMIAPDHLLTGHIRDCINLAFRLLPSPGHRRACEEAIVALLAQCMLPAQNRLFDIERKSLYSMSMSEIYSLALVAGTGFEMGFKNAGAGSHLSIVSAKCSSAIALVHSACRLVSELWFKPAMTRDGAETLKDFCFNNRSAYFTRMQRITDLHIRRVENICSMPDESYFALEDQVTSRDQRNSLEQEYSACVRAINAVDKPNVHRLRELVYTTLPMLGHLSIFGELALEKTHQVLKRAIRQSNSKEIQLQSMQSAAFDDWQGRLLLSAPLVASNDIAATRACFRLLAGRDAIWSTRGKLGNMTVKQIQNALGPGHNVVKELQAQGKSVISPRAMPLSSPTWTLTGDSRTLSPFSESSAHRVTLISNLIRVCFPDEWRNGTVVFGSSARSCYSQGATGHTFSRGNVLETLTIGRSDSPHHFPFVVQSRVIDSTFSLSLPHTATLWCVVHFVAIRTPSADKQVFAAVRPCLQYLDRSESFYPRFRVQTSGRLSLLRMHSYARFVPLILEGAHISSRTQTGTTALPQCSPLDGDPFYAVTRRHGYPPRAG